MLKRRIAVLSIIVLILSVNLAGFGMGTYWFRSSFAGPWSKNPGNIASSTHNGGSSVPAARETPRECPRCNADNLRWQIFSHMGQIFRTVDVERDRENRRKIISFILDPRNIGCTLTEISEKLGINPGTLDYYLGEFEYNYMARSNATRSYDPECHYLVFVEGGREHRFVRLQEGKYTRIWPGELKDKKRLRIMIMHMRDPIRMEILRSIGSQPGITNIMLSRLFNRNKSTMHHYLKQFHDEEIIDIRPEGRIKRCFVHDDVRNMLGA
ncbi:MAG: hypothetical protein WBZ29_03915 [Methanocella sp.]